MGPKKINNRFKIKCLECGVTMDNDYRLRHNRLFHAEMLKKHKVVRWQHANAPKNPFEGAFSCSPSKISRTDESTESMLSSQNNDRLDAETFSTSDVTPNIDDRLSCSSEKLESLCYIKQRGKQSSTTQKPIATDDVPFQPRDPKFFPNRGNKSRSFRPSWFDHPDWKTWLHYDKEKDAAFCFTCIKAVEQNLISSKNTEQAFISAGYKNWSNAATTGRGFDKHNQSEAHREAHLRFNVIPSQRKDIGEQLSQAHAEEKSANREALLKILSNVRFLARQSLPLRGDGDGSDSNFTQLYLLREEDNPILRKWRTEKKTDKYVHNDIQNEMMKIMALQILREVAKNIQNADFYSLMGDEATDVSNVSQLVICLRWVDDDLVAHDEFIGLKDMPRTNADSIVRELKDVLIRMNLKLNKCRGQCYDGCSTMRGHKNGVVVQIKEEENRTLYTHCYTHSLNLAVGDTMRNSDILKHTLDNTFELTKLVKNSAKRDAKLSEIKKTIADDTDNENLFGSPQSKPSVSMFCPTRWTARGSCLLGVIENFDELQQLWDWAVDNTSDTSLKARIRGIASYSNTFSYCFGIHLAETILRNTDNLSKTMQATQLSAVDVQRISRDTVTTLKSDRTDERFKLFYEKVKVFANKHDIEKPSLPRKRNPRMVIENYFSKTPSDHPQTPEEYYRRKYFEAFDLVTTCIKDRFDQKDFEMYATCEQLLVKSANKQDYVAELETVINFYKDDFDRCALDVQLKTLPHTLPSNEVFETFHDILKEVKKLSKGQKGLISEVVKLLKLVIVMPATNAVSERCFSGMRRLYTYLRTNMTQNRLNHTMMLHVHKEKTDALSLVNVANEFVFGSEHRLKLFGKFTEVDLQK